MRFRIARVVACAAVAIAVNSTPSSAQTGATTLGTIAINATTKATITVQATTSGEIRAFVEDGDGLSAVVFDVTPSEARAWADAVGTMLAAAPGAPSSGSQTVRSPSLSRVSGIEFSVSRTDHPALVAGLAAPYFVFASDDTRQQAVSGAATADTVQRFLELLREAAAAAEKFAQGA